jgi:magnesium transporter
VRVLDTLDRDAISALRASGEFFWLDLLAPSDEDVDALGETFGFHELALEDTKKFGQRPKLDDYADHVQLVFYGVGRDGAPGAALVETHLYVSGDFVVTVRRRPCAELDAARARIASGPAPSEEYVVYRILDSLTDSFFPVLSQMDDEIDELEEDMVKQPTDEQLARLFSFKRRLVTLRRIVGPQRDLLASGGDLISRVPGLHTDRAHDYFRDVYDHLIRISDLIDSYRDLLTGAMDVYLSTVSNRLNGVMKQLTIISTIFLPLTFVTGFFGQNFGWMVDHVDTWQAFVGYGVGGMLATGIALLFWFRRRGFLN